MSNAPESSVLEKTKLKEPVMWTVVFHNDDYTPMEFVVEILITIFHLDLDTATEVMLTVHTEGRCPVGKFTKEIAITKATDVCKLAEEKGHPLQATPEEV
jgi:ATP-dependent Clp protease adaptor protein ClpS